MEQRKQMLAALAVAAIIAAAVLSSFLMPLFFGGTPEVKLPDTSAVVLPGDNTSGEQSPDGGSYVKVEVTPETVQNVIATLDRPVSYYREMTVETIWGEGESEQSACDVEVWVDGGFTKIKATLPGGLVQYRLIGDGKEYLWYAGDQDWYEVQADELSADLAQRIPTYEDVLGLDQSTITDTGYEVLNSLSCIYVEVEDDLLSYLERYWVDVESGLLVSAETVKDGMVVSRMTSGTTDFPVRQNASFALPDGTVLYQVSQT